MEPTVVPRSDHTISRRQIEPEALKVLYRLRQFGHAAYLVGGSVRDLLLGRPPKDFDIGTSAHPYQVKRLFRNCWIIGRRFRLAHIKFGAKTIEVATFRRQVSEPAGPDPGPARPTRRSGAEVDAETPATQTGAHTRDGHHRHGRPHTGRPPIHRDNTFGTAEEDAFRRDFTINALFYDIATFSVIDYVGGLQDLEARLIRCIGDPNERFLEDPVRMLRALAHGARLGFRIDSPIHEAIGRHRATITQAAPARLLDELYKILRSGAAERTFYRLFEMGLLKHISPELARKQSAALWRSLAELDLYRARFETAPSTLTNPVLLGSLLVPTRLLEPLPPETGRRRDRENDSRFTLGMLTLARRDVQHLRQIVGLQQQLHDPGLPYRAQRALMHREVYAGALTWLEIHGGSSATLERWRSLGEIGGAAIDREAARPRRRRRRRRRRRGAKPARP